MCHCVLGFDFNFFQFPSVQSSEIFIADSQFRQKNLLRAKNVKVTNLRQIVYFLLICGF